MTEFKDTGLPYDTGLFRAFMACAKNAKGKNARHPVLTAQILAQMMPENPEAATLALLSYLPDAAHTAIKKQFGENRADIASEAAAHMRTAYAYLEGARPEVKAIATASAIAHIMEFDAAVEDIVKTVRGFRAAGSRAQPDIDPPVIPAPRILDQIAKTAHGKTGSDALDWTLVEKLENYRMEAEEKLAAIGMDMPPEFAFADFEETGIFDDPKVRNAYETLVSNTHANPPDVMQAIDAAQLLSAFPETQNPAAIAAALLDIGLAERTATDMKFLQNRADWDVLELIGNHPVRGVKTAEKIAAAPLEFRQLALAWAVVTLAHAEMQGRRAFERLKEQEEMLPGNLASMLRQHALAGMTKTLDSAGVVEQAAPLAEAPALQEMLAQKLQSLKALVAQNTPKPLLMLPAPKPEKPDLAKGVDL